MERKSKAREEGNLKLLAEEFDNVENDVDGKIVTTRITFVTGEDTREIEM